MKNIVGLFLTTVSINGLKFHPFGSSHVRNLKVTRNYPMVFLDFALSSNSDKLLVTI